MKFLGCLLLISFILPCFPLQANPSPWSCDYPDYVKGRYGEGLKCDWVRARIYLKSPGYLNPREGTIQFWVSPTIDLQSLGDYSIILYAAPSRPAHDPSQMSVTLLPAYDPNSYQERGILFNLNGENGGRAVLSPLDWKAGEWHALAVTWGEQGYSAYVDGKLIGKTSRKPAFFDEVPELISFGSGMMTRELTSHCIIDEIQVSDHARSADYIEKFAKAAAPLPPDAHVLALNHCEPGSPQGYWKMTETFRADVKPGMQASSGYLTHNHLFSTREKIALPVTLFNPGSREENFLLTVRVQDFYKEKVGELETDIALKPGEVREVDLDASFVKAPGFYEYLLECKVGNEVVYSKTRSFVLTEYFPRENLRPDQNMFGHHMMNMRRADVFSRLGIAWERSWHTASFRWPTVELKKGVYDWRAADYYVKTANEIGVKIVGVLGDTPEWAGVPPVNKAEWKNKFKIEKFDNYRPRNLKEFYKYVFDTVSRYKDSVKHWEIWNEPDWNRPDLRGFAFGGTDKDYLDVLKTAYAAAKEADPSCVVLSGGMVPLEHLAGYLAENQGTKYFDVIGMHRYRPWGEFNKIVQAFQKASDAPKPVWQTERVTNNAYLGVSEIRDAILSGLEKYFYFGARNYFTKEAWLPFDKYFSVALCVEKLHGRSYSGEIAFKGSQGIVQGLLFDKGRETQLALLFAPSEIADALKLRVSSPPQTDLSFTHYMGKTASLTNDGAGVVFPVEEILYVEGNFDPDNLEILSDKPSALLANASFEEYEGDLVLEGLENMKVPGWIVNATRHDPEGRIALDNRADSGKLALSVSSSGQGRVNVTQKTQAASPGTYVLAASMKIGNDAVGLKPQLAFYFPKNTGTFPEKVAVDLNEDEWTRVVLEYEIPDSRPVVAVCGIKSGQGTVLIDDVFFGRKEDMPLVAGDFPEFHFIDLASSFNDTFLDDSEGDGKGGFADLGDNPLKYLASGLKEIGGTPFQLKNDPGEKSCLILRGKKRPGLPEQSGPIKVSQELKELGFLYTALLSPSKSGDKEGVFLITLKSGKSYEHPLIYGKNIHDWYVPGLPKNFPVALALKDSGNIERALFTSTWKNPDPSDPVESVQFRSEGKSIPVLLAMTGKK